MTQEEKARAYDEALKVLHKYDGANIMFSQDLKEEMFPELKESEDERIRKALIHLVNSNKELSFGIDNYDGIKWSDILAWLEKQGDANKEYWRGYREGKQEILDKYAELEKQVEQKSYDTCDSSMTDDKKSPYSEKRDFGYFEEKPADKIEPKFHEGNWIVNNNSGGVCQVTEIRRDDKYCLWPLDSEIMGYLRIIDVDNDYHLWTIQDAKDGDVLVSKYDIPFIYNGNLDSFNIGSYCGITTEGMFNVATEKCHWTENVNIHPATKEQRDTLEKAMADAGYTFDFEKKELKKIEQKPIDKPKFKVKYAGSEYNVFETKDIAGVTFYGIEDEPNHIDYVKADNCEIISGYGIKESGLSIPTKPVMFSEQNPTWSKEDENVMWLLKDIVKHSNEINENIYTMPLKEKLYDWLKSLRPQNHWKPTEEHMRHL